MHRRRSIARRSIVLVPLALIPVATLAGCGGPEQVSTAELVQKGDAICRQEQAKFSQIQATPLVNASEGADRADQLHGVAQDSIDSLRDFEPPEPQRAAYDRYLNAKENTLQYFDQGKEAADNRDGRAYSAAETAVAQGAPERAALAKALGFKVCSQGPGTGLAAGQ
jgi:hypothetical protein